MFRFWNRWFGRKDRNQSHLDLVLEEHCQCTGMALSRVIDGAECVLEAKATGYAHITSDIPIYDIEGECDLTGYAFTQAISEQWVETPVIPYGGIYGTTRDELITEAMSRASGMAYMNTHLIIDDVEGDFITGIIPGSTMDDLAQVNSLPAMALMGMI